MRVFVVAGVLAGLLAGCEAPANYGDPSAATSISWHATRWWDSSIAIHGSEVTYFRQYPNQPAATALREIAVEDVAAIIHALETDRFLDRSDENRKCDLATEWFANRIEVDLDVGSHAVAFSCDPELLDLLGKITEVSGYDAWQVSL